MATRTFSPSNKLEFCRHQCVQTDVYAIETCITQSSQLVGERNTVGCHDN